MQVIIWRHPTPPHRSKENSVLAITELCRKSKPNQAAFSEAGGIPKLVSVLLGFSPGGTKD